MGIVQTVTAFALRPLFQAAGLEAAAATRVAGFLIQHFSDPSQKLPRALARANDRAWKALQMALDGDSWWTWCKARLASGQEKALVRQVQVFLQAAPLPELTGNPPFREMCLRELREARRQGVLTRGNLNPHELVRQAGDLATLGDPGRALQAERQALAALAADLRPTYANLADLVALPASPDQSLLVAAVRYFFRREVETDQELFQGLAFAQMEKLEQTQEAGFAALAGALQEHSQRLAELLDDIRAAVAETHGAVLDIRSEQQNQGGQLQEIYREVVRLKQQLALQPSEVRPRDSLSIRSEAERRMVREVLGRFRALPADRQRTLPALRNSLAQLQVVTGEFEAAQQDFRAVADCVADPQARAEAHHNAYRAALERSAWAEGLGELRRAAALDSERFSPFPFAKYEPQRILGAGGFGVAFLCRHLNTNSYVVVKTLHADGLDRDVAEVFAEAHALELLEHPAIIRLRDCDYADAARSRPYLVMDYFDGQTLAEYVDRHGALESDDLLALARQVAEGLKAAHAKGILHRDVKPANLLVQRSNGEQGAAAPRWRVKLIDFGLALKQSVMQATVSTPGMRSRTTVGSSIAGTIDYAAPEQIGRLPGVAIGPHSDVYGFARTCCYALFRTAQPTLQHWRKLPEPLAELLDSCLAESPADRLANFAAVLPRLAGIKAHEASRAEEAINQIEAAAAEKARAAAQAYLQRGYAAYQNGDHARAIADLTEALRLDPTSGLAYEYRATAHVALGQDERALADYNEALRQNSASWSAHAGRGRLYSNRGDCDRALADLGEALQLNPAEGWLYLYRGETCAKMGLDGRAIADYSAALRINPQLSWAHVYRGDIYVRRGEYDTAIADYDAALRLEPTLAMARSRRDEAWRLKKQHDRPQLVEPISVVEPAPVQVRRDTRSPVGTGGQGQQGGGAVRPAAPPPRGGFDVASAFQGALGGAVLIGIGMALLRWWVPSFTWSPQVGWGVLIVGMIIFGLISGQPSTAAAQPATPQPVQQAPPPKPREKGGSVIGGLLLIGGIVLCVNNWPAISAWFNRLVQGLKQPQAKRASSPDEAVRFMVEYARAGDVQGMLGQMAADPRRLIESALDKADAEKAYLAALDNRFGKQAGVPPQRDPRKEMTSLKKMDILSREAQGPDRFNLKVKLTSDVGGTEKVSELIWVAVKEDGAWKLMPPSHGMGEPDAAHYRAYTDWYLKTKDVYVRETTAVNQGIYLTRQAAQDRLLPSLPAFPKLDVKKDGGDKKPDLDKKDGFGKDGGLRPPIQNKEAWPKEKSNDKDKWEGKEKRP